MFSKFSYPFHSIHSTIQENVSINLLNLSKVVKDNTNRKPYQKFHKVLPNQNLYHNNNSVHLLQSNSNQLKDADEPCYSLSNLYCSSTAIPTYSMTSYLLFISCLYFFRSSVFNFDVHHLDLLPAQE